jgi:hypothetical protein
MKTRKSDKRMRSDGNYKRLNQHLKRAEKRIAKCGVRCWTGREKEE